MCIIIVKPYGKKIPHNHLQEAFNRNRDGAGVAYTTGKGVTIKKGYFDFNHFMRKCGKYNREDVSAIFHFRITTHGGTRAELCHPFPITNDDGDIKKLKITKLSYAVAHNGIFRLDGLTIPTGDSDTTAFIKSHLYPLYMAREQEKDPTTFDNIINSLVNGCRLAVLSNNGYTKRYGKGWQEDGGCYYSNGSYKPYVWTTYQRPAYQWQSTKWQGGTTTKQTTPTQTPKNFTLHSYDWDEDSGYYAGCYWWQGERVERDEYEALRKEQEQTKIWADILEANRSNK